MADQGILIDLSKLSEGEAVEMTKLGLLSEEHTLLDPVYPEIHKERAPILKHDVQVPQVLSNAYDYRKPSSFSRALRLDLGGYRVLLISGTASVNEVGKPEHVGDFRAQLWRTYRNITTLLSEEGMSWHDVVRTTNYLKDMERNYGEFNEIRTAFFTWLKLDPLPASTAIQAHLCWPPLLVEIEAYAICKYP